MLHISVFEGTVHCPIYCILSILSCVLVVVLTGSHLNYPEGSVLLETRLRYGKVSEEANDVVKRENGWQIPEEVKDDLELRYAKTPNTGVKFVVRDNKLATVIFQSWFRWYFGTCCTIL